MSEEREKKNAEQPQIRKIPPKKVVVKLAVGQEMQGTVKRLTDFGAFVDIGVGTDGLVHVSEMALTRVNKPKDILKVGDEVSVWIKSLDKQRNRISLTMISPDTLTIRDLKVGEIVSGTVTRIENYGAFVDIGIGYDGMVHVKELAHGYVKHPSDIVTIGQEVEAEVLKINRRRGQVDLSMRTITPEPEPEPDPEVEEEYDPEVEEEEEVMPTAMELALMQAQSSRRKKDRKRKKNRWYDDDDYDDDDVVSRTLSLADES